MHRSAGRVSGYFIAIFLLLSSLQGHTQYYLSGQDASSIKWKQLNSTHFKIIFPVDYEKEASRVASLLETSYPILREGLGAAERTTRVIIHPHSVIPNATAAWAPIRLDFYQTTPQDGYSQDWMKQLSLHELRHIVQFSALDKGFGKIISTITGQQGTAAVAGAFVPRWFIEGDAVTTETIFSASGRGRQSRFSAGLKAQLVTQGTYSYGKAYFGSFKDHVPDIYELGYHLVAYNQMKYGKEIWHSAIDRTARQPWRIKPFSSGIRKVTGLNKKQLYNISMAELKTIWEKQLKATEPGDVLSPDVKSYTSYKSPKVLKSGQIVAIKSSLSDINAIVSIDSAAEKIIVRPGILLHDWLSVNDSLIVWAEYRPDKRWSNVSYSVLNCYSFVTGVTRQISHQSRLSAPDLSPGNESVVAVEQGEISGSSLIIINLGSAEIKWRVTNSELSFQTPRWHPDSKKIYFTAIGNKGKAIFEWKPGDTSIYQLTPYTFTDFSLSQVNESGILLQGDWLGHAGLFLWNFSSQRLELLTERPFAAIDPVIDQKNNRMIFADYSAGGYQLVSLPVDPDLKPKTVAFDHKASHFIADSLAGTSFNLDKVILDTASYPSTSYNRLAHLFNFHSWSPVHIDASNGEVNPGFSLFSQNVLSTMVTELGYIYDPNEQTGKYLANLTYLGWFPELTFGISQGLRRGVAVNDGQHYDLKWSETDWNLSAAIPLNFSRGSWLKGMRTSFSFRHLYRKMEPGMPLGFSQNSSDMLSYSAVLYKQRRQAQRDLYPKTGQVLQFVFRHSPFDVRPAKQFFAGAVFYFPGFMKNHGIKLYASYQTENRGYVSFGNLAAIPRGYTGITASEQSVLKLDYALPLWYPDLDVPTVMYLKRIRAYFFADYLYATDIDFSGDLFSTGAEIMSDWYFFNVPAPVNLGLRISYRNYYRDVVPELLFGINFDAL